MTNFQMTSGVIVDVRAAFEKQMAMNTRIALWIELKSSNKTSVTIGQLASHLKIRKEFVPDLVESLYRTYGTDADERFNQLWIFVDNEQVPAWLQTFLSPPVIRRIRIKARNRDGLDQLERATLRLNLHAVPNFDALLKRVWEHGRDAITRTLYTTEFIGNTEGLNLAIDITRTSTNGNFGEVRPSYMDAVSGIQWHLTYATLSYHRQDKLDFTQPKKVKLDLAGPQKKVKSTRYTPKLLEEAKTKIEKLVAWMLVMDYTLYQTTMSMDGQSNIRPVLVFAGKSGMGETIRVTLPYLGLRVRIE